MGNYATRQANKAERAGEAAAKAKAKGKIVKYKKKQTKAAVAEALSGKYGIDQSPPTTRKRKQEIKEAVTEKTTEELSEGQEYAYKNPRQERKDLKRMERMTTAANSPLKQPDASRSYT